MPLSTVTAMLDESVMMVARRDTMLLQGDDTVRKALDDIRSHGLTHRTFDFFVVDATGRLTGVIPVRRLLTTALDERLAAVMVREVSTVPRTTTIMQAHELMVEHKLMALPVVDADRQVLGVIDIAMFLNEQRELDDRTQIDEAFAILGFRLSQVRDAAPFRAFRFRFPWLISTIAGGVACALLASLFATTLAHSLVLAFFLTLVLGLGESVAVQSMTVTCHALRTQPRRRWYLQALRREFGTACLLGLACGGIVGPIVWAWHGSLLPALVIAGSILAVLVAACIYGLGVPSLLHAMRLDPRISAGPLTLALTDISTILIYLGLATALL